MLVDTLIVHQANNSLELANKTVVVIDVLRATSTIVTALGNKAFEVIPVLEPGEVMDLVRTIGAPECVTGGERKGFRIEGLELGNSPAEYTQAKVEGKKVILCTSNGTKAVKRVQGAAEVIIGSYLNMRAVVDYLSQNSQDLLLICSGSGDSSSLEDMACAGLIIRSLVAKGMDCQLTDSTKLALYACEHSLALGLAQFIRQTDHGRYLAENGMAQDLDDCAALDTVLVLPRFYDGKIAL